MKKIFTLIAATFLTVAVFAADRRPVVTVNASRNYEIVIDGKSYFNSNGFMSISDIRKGQHSIKVYQVSRSFMFRKAKRLIDASTFQLRNNDVDIAIDFRGQISITEDRFDRDWRNGRDNDYGHDKDGHDQDGHDRGHDNDKKDWGKRF